MAQLSCLLSGLTCIQKRGGSGEECICILQLTEAGDVFYQVLEPFPHPEDEPLPQQEAKTPPQLRNATTSGRRTAEQATLADSQPVISDTSSDEDAIGPTQGLTVQRFVAETQEWKPELNTHSDASSDDSESERRRKLKRLLLQVVVNDDPELDEASGLDAGVKDGRASKDKADDAEETVSSLSHVDPEQQTPVKLSDGALVTWKHWLQKLMHKSRDKKARPRCLPHLTITTEGLLHHPPDEMRDLTEEERVQSLRRGLRVCMSNRSLLLHGTVSASPGPPDTIPNAVDTGVWTDQLSQRLTVSWQGEEVWRAWWEEQLGLNREEKVQALKRKRRREKEAKRATGRRLELSGSFTSSVSYQSELDDFSDSTGWSSAASQGASSDSGATGPLSQLGAFMERGTPRSETPATVQTDTPVPTPTATPQKMNDHQNDQQTPSSLRAPRTPSLSQTLKAESTPSSQRRSKRPAEQYLSSLFAPQVRGAVRTCPSSRRRSSDAAFVMTKRRNVILSCFCRTTFLLMR